MKKYLFITIGCLTLVLGTIGVVLPILPTVPFYMITLYCFAKSSDKLHTWFLETNLYKKHLESYVNDKGMTIKTKVSIILMVSILMGFGIIMMLKKEIYIPCVILLCVWLGHILYFGLRVKTISEEESYGTD